MNADFNIKDCLLGAVKLTKNADPYKYSYSGYGVGFDFSSHFSLAGFDWGKIVVIFGVDNSSSVHIDKNKKYILVPGEGPTQGLGDTMITADARCPINFSKSQRKFCSSLHYNGGNSFLFVNARKIHQFKVKTLKQNHIHCV